ncbi:MAG: hypothetical protein JNN20_06220 [Betaproteobacteria bacterium]|nr:hypothetical protein [Betaproteobacteria bacterium]
MDYDTWRTVAYTFGAVATLSVVPLLMRHGRKYWSVVALIFVCVGCLYFYSFSLAPSPEKAWWRAGILTAIGLFFGILLGIGQRKYFESRAKKQATE